MYYIDAAARALYIFKLTNVGPLVNRAMDAAAGALYRFMLTHVGPSRPGRPSPTERERRPW